MQVIPHKSYYVLSLITKYYWDVKVAKEDRDRLYKEVVALRHVLQKVKELVEGPNAPKVPHLASYIKKCRPDITDLETKLDLGKRGKVMKRFGGRALKWPFDTREVDKYISTFERHKNAINVTLNLDQIPLILDIDRNVTQLNVNQDLFELDQQLAKLSYATGAAFDSYRLQHESQCIPNTRVDFLSQLEEWSTNSDRCIFWLSGMADTGKSTIARTIAHFFSGQGRLGARFFFSKGGGDLGHAGKFVTTLAYQLANTSPSLKRLVCDALTEQDNITQKDLRSQWKELIL